GRINEALRMADQLVAIDPTDPSHHFKKAVLFQQQGMTEQSMHEFVRVVELAPVESDMFAEARQAIDAMDDHQIRQIILLASEDPVFRIRLPRDPEMASRDRGFRLSPAGSMALQQLDLDGLGPSQAEARPAAYH